METSTKPSGRNQRWISIVIGIIAIIIGFWCVFTPASTIAALTILFIAGFFAAGCLELWLAFTRAGAHNWGWRLTLGILDIALGIWLCIIPATQAAVVLIYVVGFYIFFYSGMAIGEACHLKRLGVPGWGWMLFFAIFGLIMAFFFLISPAFGGACITWLAGLAFLSYGIFRCMLPTD